MDISEKRKQKRDKIQMIPQNVPGQEGLVQIDVTWGIIQPIQAAEKVITVGELEVNDHLEKGLPIVDARKHDNPEIPTIKGSLNIPHTEMAERMDELDREQPTVFYCNGPQCPQSPTAIQSLLEAGYPPEKILYYRGGMHDWISLGLPVERAKL
ncbi:MAG: rhodanese-like domain-containing protein [Candidatus Marinimicrobia bacterium]|nr:rhodanese-like domain-containing protein [Candidatus Neomarinimicrobiota bacterium]